MAEIKYRYAYDDEGKLIDINDVSKENNTLHSYVCVGCGNEIRPRAIDSRYKRAHFYHKEPVECSGETYLHKLAKEKIKNKFESSTSFLICYDMILSCSEQKCSIRCGECNNRKKSVTVDLKEHYNKCELEKEIIYKDRKYIADILLTNEDNPNYPPMLMEIWVSHPCDDDKKYSGLPIIEIKIDDEQSLIDLVNESRITECDKVKLYGVDRKKQEHLSRTISRFYHIPDKGAYIKPIDCDRVNEILSDESDIEVNVFYRQDSYGEGTFIERNGLENYLIGRYFIEDCFLCEHRKTFKNYEIENNQLRSVITKHCSIGIETPDENLSCFKRRKCDVAYDFIPSNYSFNVIKDSRPKVKDVFYVAIAASNSFCNNDYVEQKFIHYLKDKMKDFNIILTAGITNCTSGASGYMAAFYLSQELGLPLVEHQADWQKYGKKAAYYMNLKVLNRANALLYFWNGKETDPRFIVIEAKKRKIPIRVIDYSKEKELCPLCGGKMIKRKGIYGYFYGCSNYPDCKEIRNSIDEENKL